MSKFIEVTLLNGESKLINAQYIISIESTPHRTDGAKSCIVVENLGAIYVTDYYPQLKVDLAKS